VYWACVWHDVGSRNARKLQHVLNAKVDKSFLKLDDFTDAYVYMNEYEVLPNYFGACHLTVTKTCIDIYVCMHMFNMMNFKCDP
jgi:hypothetical protein